MEWMWNAMWAWLGWTLAPLAVAVSIILLLVAAIFIAHYAQRFAKFIKRS